MDGDFDFDAWAALARDEPQEFERRRLMAIDEVWQRLGPYADRRRIAGTCWRIDMERARAKTPLQCCLRLSSLMWESVSDLCAAWNDWQSLAGTGKAPVLTLKKHGDE